MSGSGNIPPVSTSALWTWGTPVSGQPMAVQSFPTVSGSPTKTGLGPQDLKDYLQIPIQMYGNPPVPIQDPTIVQWIRYAEDEVETETAVRLCQTWIAAPPAKSSAATRAANLVPKYNYQQLGIDYDFEEPAYDFFFPRAQDEGWLYQRLRWRPVKQQPVFDPAGVFDALDSTGVKAVSEIYPLLNEFFRIPPSWFVEDQQRGLIRMVPAANVQMLPLFALQLTLIGFSQSLPGGLWFQYVAGLTAADYAGSWSFVRQLVLAATAVTALSSMQTSLNFGAVETQVQADGLIYRSKYNPAGPFAGQIAFYREEVKRLTRKLKFLVGGIPLGVL